MAKNKVKLLLIYIITALITFGIVFTYINKNRDDGILGEITINGNSEHSYRIDNLFLMPGDSHENEVVFKFETQGSYKIKFDFVEENDGGLKNYIDVTMKYGDYVLIEDGLLKDVLDGDMIEYDYEHVNKNKVATSLIIIYSMNEKVGEGLTNDEQQSIMGTSADFSLNITVERQ